MLFLITNFEGEPEQKFLVPLDHPIIEIINQMNNNDKYSIDYGDTTDQVWHFVSDIENQNKYGYEYGDDLPAPVTRIFKCEFYCWGNDEY